MHDIHLPPPRSGDYSSVNRHLTAGGTVEGIPRENPYREYYLSLIKKHTMKAQYTQKELYFMYAVGIVVGTGIGVTYMNLFGC